MLALRLFGGSSRGAEVTYAAAYGPLLDQLGVGNGLPTLTESPKGGGGGGGEGSAGDKEDDSAPLLGKDGKGDRD